MRRGLLAPRLIALFAAGWLLFDLPLLGVWARHPMTIFLGWAVLIGALAWLMERGGRDDG